MNPAKRSKTPHRNNFNDRKLLAIISNLITRSEKKGIEEVLVRDKSGLKPRTYAATIRRLLTSKCITKKRRSNGCSYLYINEISPSELQTSSPTPLKTPPKNTDLRDGHLYIKKEKEKETETELEEEIEDQPSFEEFIEIMPRRRDGLMHKDAAERIWNTLADNGKDLREVIEGAREYAARVPEICTYALTPLRFLKGKVYRDYTTRPFAARAPFGAAGDGGGVGARVEDVWNVVLRELEDYAGDVTVLLKAEIRLENTNANFVKVFLTFEKGDTELTYREIREVRENLPKIRRLLSKHLDAEVRSVEVIAPDLTPDDLYNIWHVVIDQMRKKTYYGDLSKLRAIRLTVAGDIAYLTAADHLEKGDLKDIKRHTTQLRHLIKRVAGVDIRNLIIK